MALTCIAMPCNDQGHQSSRETDVARRQRNAVSAGTTPDDGDPMCE
jgi:hypothetical protein